MGITIHKSFKNIIRLDDFNFFVFYEMFLVKISIYTFYDS